jgi:hypothetical protein
VLIAPTHKLRVFVFLSDVLLVWHSSGDRVGWLNALACGLILWSRRACRKYLRGKSLIPASQQERFCSAMKETTVAAWQLCSALTKQLASFVLLLWICGLEALPLKSFYTELSVDATGSCFYDALFIQTVKLGVPVPWELRDSLRHISVREYLADFMYHHINVDSSLGRYLLNVIVMDSEVCPERLVDAFLEHDYTTNTKELQDPIRQELLAFAGAYIHRLRNPATYASTPEIIAMCHLLNINILLVHSDGRLQVCRPILEMEDGARRGSPPRGYSSFFENTTRVNSHYPASVFFVNGSPFLACLSSGTV